MVETTQKHKVHIPKHMANKKYFVVTGGVDPLTNQVVSGKLFNDYAEARRTAISKVMIQAFRTAREALEHLHKHCESGFSVEQNYYIVTHGVDPDSQKTITDMVFTCHYEASKYTEAVAKGNIEHFNSLSAALYYFKNKVQRSVAREKKSASRESSNQIEKADYIDQDSLQVYVDGGFDKNRNVYSYGVVYIKDGKVLNVEKGIGKDPKAVEMRHVGGELFSAIRALLYAKKHGYSKVVLFHDFEGTHLHATGVSKQTNEYTNFYRAWMKDFMENSDVSVSFCKVEAHTGNEFNELADGLAKEAAGMEPELPFYRTYYKHCLHLLQASAYENKK